MEIEPVDLVYEESGSGEPVVLLHGFPFNRSIWRPVAELIASRARVILPDLRGYGDSPVTEGAYEMRTLAEDVAALLDALGLEKVILGGHSMGGYAALAFAKAYPQRLSGLALIASQPDADTPEKRQSRLNQARNVRRYGVRSMAKTMPEHLTNREEVRDQVRQIIQAAEPTGVIGALKGMAARPDATAWLSTIHVPTLIVSGCEDQIIPAEKPRTFVNFLPRGWLVEIPCAGHMPMLEAPEALAGALLQLVQHVANVRHTSPDVTPVSS